MAANVLDLETTEYSEVLNDRNLAQFLGIQKWTPVIDRTFDQTWVQQGAVGERVASVLLPRDTTFVDYSKRLREAVDTIAQVYGWSLSGLAEQVAAVHADLFFVRVSQDMSDGTIPLRQASALLDGIDQMIRTAALVAYRSDHTGRGGRMPDLVKHFMADDVRMGHTKKGSFIITVAARLDDAPLPPAAEDSDDPAPTDYAPSFTRQVMTTLSRGLDVTRRHAARGDDFVELQSAVESGLRLPLVEALREMGEAEGLQSLDMSFEWAGIEPQRADVPDHIQLTRAVIEQLPELERRLTQVAEPQNETIIGPVLELKRLEDSDEEESGAIVMRADVHGKSLKVTVPLAAVDYDLAIRAHRAKVPFTVSGVLSKEGRSWELVRDISVDREFLDHHFANSLRTTEPQ
jgi:hypothetical protein